MRTLTAVLATTSLLFAACKQQSCDDDVPAELILGQGASSAFEPLEDGAEVALSIAPQGGMGVSVRALSRGLATDEVLDVQLITRIDGEQTGLFETNAILTCQEDGHGLLWGQVVGFDRDEFPDLDSLIALDGELVDLVVIATDSQDRTAEGSATITLRVAR
jgi:hypothetical protein